MGLRRGQRPTLTTRHGLARSYAPTHGTPSLFWFPGRYPRESLSPGAASSPRRPPCISSSLLGAALPTSRSAIASVVGRGGERERRLAASCISPRRSSQKLSRRAICAAAKKRNRVSAWPACPSALPAGARQQKPSARRFTRSILLGNRVQRRGIRRTRSRLSRHDIT